MFYRLVIRDGNCSYVLRNSSVQIRLRGLHPYSVHQYEKVFHLLRTSFLLNVPISMILWLNRHRRDYHQGDAMHTKGFLKFDVFFFFFIDSVSWGEKRCEGRVFGTTKGRKLMVSKVCSDFYNLCSLDLFLFKKVWIGGGKRGIMTSDLEIILVKKKKHVANVQNIKLSCSAW